MNKEECLQIIRASAWDTKYVTVQQEKSPSETKYNTSGKLKFPVLDHGLAPNLQPLGVKLTRFYFLNEAKIKPRVNTNSIKCTWKELFIQSELLWWVALHGKSLSWRWSFVSQASLARLLHAVSELASWDSAVFSFTLFIAIRFVLKNCKYKRNCTRAFLRRLFFNRSCDWFSHVTRWMWRESWFTSSSRVLPTSHVVYCAGKPIENAVYCLNISYSDVKS